ncbi:MAG: hypothetical protein WCT05_00380 [Lentisphaeria bacterium]
MSTQECEVLEGQSRPNRLRLKNGLIYSFLQIPSRNTSATLLGEIHASGSGKISLHTSTCIRTPSSEEKGFSHSIRKEAGSFELSPKQSSFRFSVEVEPYEQGYLYINVHGEAVVNHLSVVLQEMKNEESRVLLPKPN